MQNQVPNSIHGRYKFSRFTVTMVVEVSNEHFLKLNKMLENFFGPKLLNFCCFCKYYASMPTMRGAYKFHRKSLDNIFWKKTHSAKIEVALATFIHCKTLLRKLKPCRLRFSVLLYCERHSDFELNRKVAARQTEVTTKNPKTSSSHRIQILHHPITTASF